MRVPNLFLHIFLKLFLVVSREFLFYGILGFTVTDEACNKNFCLLKNKFGSFNYFYYFCSEIKQQPIMKEHFYKGDWIFEYSDNTFLATTFVGEDIATHQCKSLKSAQEWLDKINEDNTDE